MRILLNAGMCEPQLSERAVKRLRELGWKHAFNPHDLPEEEMYEHDCMILAGEKDWTGEIEEWGYAPLRSNRGQRHDPLVLQVFDEMGQDMFNPDASKWIVHAIEVPDGLEYEIWQSENSWESIHEKHRIWYCPGGESPLRQGEKAAIQALRDA